MVEMPLLVYELLRESLRDAMSRVPRVALHVGDRGVVGVVVVPRVLVGGHISGVRSDLVLEAAVESCCVNSYKKTVVPVLQKPVGFAKYVFDVIGARESRWRIVRAAVRLRRMLVAGAGAGAHRDLYLCVL